MVAMSTHTDDEKERKPLTPEDAAIDARMGRVLAMSARLETLDEASTYVLEAKTKIVAALDVLIDIEENIGPPGDALRATLPQLERAQRVLNAMRASCNRSMANFRRPTANARRKVR